MSRTTRIARSVLLMLAACGLAAPAAWGAEARLVTLSDITGPKARGNPKPRLGGPSFQGGVGDYLLRNDRIEAVILAVGTTPDGTGSRFTNGLLNSGGVLIDAGTRGDQNDQLQLVVQSVNLISASPTGGSILYRGSADGFADPELVSGPTASVTVDGAVEISFMGQTISNVENPTLTVTTTYSLTDGNSWIDISTTVTNNNPFFVPIFSVGDESRPFRNQLPFQPFPFRGSYAPPVNPMNPFPALGVMTRMPLLGVHAPGPAAVCYSFVAASLNKPFIALDAQFILATAQDFDRSNFPNFGGIPAGGTRTFDRRLVVAKGDSVENCADISLPLLYVPVLGTDARATFRGRVVSPTGQPIAGADIFFDNTSPGFSNRPPYRQLVTVIDNNQDGTADRVLPALPGSPVPSTHFKTNASGRFEVRLQAVDDPAVQASVYQGTVWAENRPPVEIGPLVVDANTIATGPVNLGDVVVAGTGTLQADVFRRLGGKQKRGPAQIFIFGRGGTADPDFGNQFQSRRNFSGLSQSEGDGGDPLTRFNTGRLGEALRGFPSVNSAVATNGRFSLDLAPGRYRIWATRGPEYTIDSTAFFITEGATTKVDLSIRRVVKTKGWVSADGHIHSAPSHDAGTDLTDRVLSYLGAGVQTMLSSDHNHMTDYSRRIKELKMRSEITSVIGLEATTDLPVPVSSLTDDFDAYPRAAGHIIAWPLSTIKGGRNNGAPAVAQMLPATLIDRLRGMDSLRLLGATPDTATLEDWLAAAQAGQPGTPGEGLPADEEVVLLAHPRATGALGPWRTFDGIGYDPTLAVDQYPNFLANLRSNYHQDYVGADGTTTRGLDFDALEGLNAATVDWYLLTREDWFSLLDQGIHRTIVAGSDTHRPVIDGAGYPRFYVGCDADSNSNRDAARARTSDSDTGDTGDTGDGTRGPRPRPIDPGAGRPTRLGRAKDGRLHHLAGGELTERVHRRRAARGRDRKGRCRQEELVEGIRGMRVVGSMGPFVRFDVRGDGEPLGGRKPFDGIGRTVTATDPEVSVRVEVSAAPWIPVEEVRIFRNGDLILTIPIASENVLDGPVRRLRQTIPIAGVDSDSYFTVEAGSALNELNDFGTFPGGEAAVNPDLLATLRRLSTTQAVSLAFTNPIFVDRDGDGYQPPGL